MNILIVGGLLGLAVLAILGAVLLGIGEDRAEKATKILEEQQASATAPLAQRPLPQPVTSQGPASQAVPATPLLSRPTAPLPVSSTGETTGSLSRADLNGQVREITGELRVLAQRAGELQQRLTILSESLENRGQARVEPPLSNSPADFFESDTKTTEVF
ncbi:MAG TPA: hypothetical protein VGM01_03195 [Ktedonobacteraceae bacterium]